MNLKDKKFLFLDCQTTGTSPKSGKIIELGWAIGNSTEIEVKSQLITPENTDEELPKKIQKLTGLNIAQLQNQKKLSKVLDEIKQQISPKIDVVIHFARFEKSFLQEFLEASYVNNLICTYEISRRVLSQLPSKSIRGVSGYLGYSIDSLKRSEDHVRATYYIWQNLLQLLADNKNITTLEQLKKWLATTKPEKKSKIIYRMPVEKRLSLPNSPGVYHLLAQNKKILYIGKATSLKSRVNQYFRGIKTKGSRINELTAQIEDINYTETKSPFEAAILENNHIKKYDPPYNIALRKEEDKKVYYFNRNLKEIDQNIPISALGPVLNKDTITIIKQSIAKNYQDENLIQIFSYMDLEENALESGIIDFCNQVTGDYKESDWKSWNKIALCHWTIYREKQKKSLENSKEEESEQTIEEKKPVPWTKENVTNYLNRLLVSVVKSYLKGRWIKRFRNCQIYWWENSQWHVAKFQEENVQFEKLSKFEKTDLPDLKIDNVSNERNFYDQGAIVYQFLGQKIKESNEIFFQYRKNIVLDKNDIKKLIFKLD